MAGALCSRLDWNGEEQWELRLRLREEEGGSVLALGVSGACINAWRVWSAARWKSLTRNGAEGRCAERRDGSLRGAMLLC